MKRNKIWLSVFRGILVAAITTLGLLTIVATAHRDDPEEKSYTLTGAIKIINDCDGEQAPIPATVTIESDLEGGNVSRPGSGTAALTPDPAAPTEPSKIGRYTVKVKWSGPKAPTDWTRPKVLSKKAPVCQSISCPDSGTCHDTATAQHKYPVTGRKTSYDIRVVCVC